MKIDGRLVALGSLFLWSLSPPLSKIGVGGIGSLPFALFVAIAIVVFSLPLFARENGWLKVGMHWKQLTLLAFFSYFLFALLFFLGMARLSAIQGSVLVGSEILFSLLLGILIGKERASAREFAFVLLLMLGIAVAVTNGALEFDVGLGAAMVIGSMLALQLGYYLAPDAIKKCGVGTLMVAGGAAQAIGTALLFGAQGAALPAAIPAAALLAVAAYALFPMVLSYAFYYEALRRIGVYKTTAIVVQAPVVSLFLSALLLGEQITIYHVAGMAVMVLAVWQITRTAASGRTWASRTPSSPPRS